MGTYPGNAQYVTKDELSPLLGDLQTLSGWATELCDQRGRVLQEDKVHAQRANNTFKTLIEMAESKDTIEVRGSSVYSGDKLITRLIMLERENVLANIKQFQDTFGESNLTETGITPIIGLEATAKRVYEALDKKVTIEPAAAVPAR